MIAVALCPSCGEVRYRSTRQYQRGEKIDPNDFVPTNGAPPPDSSQQAVCHVCQTPLAFRITDPSVLSNERPTAGGAEKGAGGAVNTLFSCTPGEEIKTMREAGSKVLIVTNRRIVTVDLDAALIDEVTR